MAGGPLKLPKFLLVLVLLLGRAVALMGPPLRPQAGAAGVGICG